MRPVHNFLCIQAFGFGRPSYGFGVQGVGLWVAIRRFPPWCLAGMGQPHLQGVGVTSVLAITSNHATANVETADLMVPTALTCIHTL